MLRLALCALVPALSTAACSTLSGGGTSALTIVAGPALATVHDTSGRVLGTTPWTTRAAAGGYSEYLLSAPGYDTILVTAGTAPADHGGAPRLHAHTVAASALGTGPVLVRVEMEPSASPDTARLTDAQAAVVFAAFADGAVAAGCEPLLSNAWRDAALLLAGGDSAPPGADTLRQAAAAEVARAAPRLRELCARRTPHMERLREIRLRLERPPEAEAEATPYAPVYFESGSYQVPDSVRGRLRELGRALAAAPMAVTLVVEGFTDGTRDERLRELGFQRAQAVIAELHAGGLRADCCELTSGGVAQDAGAADGRWGRRVTFSLDYREGAQ